MHPSAAGEKNMGLYAIGTRFPSQNSTESSKINELSTKKLKSLVLSEKSLKSLISDRHPPPPRGGVQVASWRHILSNVSTFSRDLSRMPGIHNKATTFEGEIMRGHSKTAH